MTDSITLNAQDGNLDVSLEVGRTSATITDLLEELGEAEQMPLPGAAIVELRLAVEYMTMIINERNQLHPTPDNKNVVIDEPVAITPWESEYLTRVKASGKVGDVFKLMNATNYLNVPMLLDLLATDVASDIRGKSAEEICKMYDIKCDLTPKQQEKIRSENTWCEER